MLGQTGQKMKSYVFFSEKKSNFQVKMIIFDHFSLILLVKMPFSDKQFETFKQSFSENSLETGLKSLGTVRIR